MVKIIFLKVHSSLLIRPSHTSFGSGRGEDVETSTTPDLQSEKIQNEECRRRRSSRLKKDLGSVHNMCAKVMNMMHRSTRAYIRLP